MALERRTATLDLAEPCACCGIAVGAPPPAATGAEAAAASQQPCCMLLSSQTHCCLTMLQLQTLSASSVYTTDAQMELKPFCQ